MLNWIDVEAAISITKTAQHQHEQAPDIGDEKQVKKAFQRKMVQP